MVKLIKRIPGSRILVSNLTGSALRTRVGSLSKQALTKSSQVNFISKDTHLVFSISQQASQCQTSVLKALPSKLHIKRHLPSILYISASLAMSTSVLKAFPGKLHIKRHLPSILYISENLAMSTSVLKAFLGKLGIKRHLPSIIYISASLAMSIRVLKALPCKLDIKRHSHSILYL